MGEITLLAIDLAKTVFQLHAVDEAGHTRLQRRVSRSQLMPLLATLPRCSVVMEACGSSHFWARRIRELGHRVRLIAAQHVKIFSHGQKNDRNDAQAIIWAARQPGVPEVAVKSEEQQAIQAIHRLRDRMVRDRVALGNQLHGLAAEFGALLPTRNPAKLGKTLLEKIAAGALPQLLAHEMTLQLERLRALSEQIRQLTHRLEQLAQESEACRRLMQTRGVGPIIATAFVCQVGDPAFYRNGRQLAASLGLVPRQHSSADRTRLLGITKRGDPYLRQLLVHGARSALAVARRHPDDPVSRWVLAVQERRGTNRAVVALANKMTRHLWANLRYGACA